ncbi:Mfa1 family fimbria major subunit [uncultured Prevotella sp.]|uniref:Mfa1 family fimbria major subunit n=1 Tax=uncultured Prevotella sp. TaxID=159272 RepID=UPI0027E36489|nr:Mfa1 family fimbria major subunit [uncultured Prevotella sp.]
MKNVKNLFGMAVMATALVGCSSNDNLNPNPNEGAGKAGTAYAKFTIQLPTVSGTRAVDPKTGADFNGGTADEYAVKDAQLVIFEKLSDSEPEGAYKFVETVNIGNLEPWTNNTPNTGVTRYANITAKLNGVSIDKIGGKYYALIILNNAGESKVKLPTSGTYSEWNVAANAGSAADFLNSDNGFYMSNAPLLKSGAPQTLVSINGVYSTKEEAQTKPATTVYVERGMAKVTVDGSDYTFNATSAFNKDKVSITKWTLDVMNQKTFPVHTTTGLTDKFATIWSTDRFHAGADPQRVYWGTDPNYSMTTLTTVPACKGEFYLLDREGKTYNGVAGSTVTWADKTKPLYCLENTFDIDNMKQGQTTRVVFKATYTPFVLAGATTAADKTFFMIGNNTKIWTKTNLEQQIANKAKELLNTTGAVTATISGDLLDGGSHLLKTGNVTIKEGTVAKNDDIDFAALNTKLGLNNTKKDENGNPTVGIKTYENGVCYYIARIKHFNGLTPWNPGQPTYKDASLTDDQNNEAFLGRYGVLRNNWYDLEVTKFSAPGYPDVPVVDPKTPDDEDTKYINVEVKILDWAKRSQSVEL